MNKKRILILNGTMEESLQPVPPVADGAPQWNVFRLSEAAVCNPHCMLDIHVISPCDADQKEAICIYPVSAKGKYHHIVFRPAELTIYHRFLRHLLPLRLLVRRLARLPDLLSWLYLLRALPHIRAMQPDVLVINDRPQYIQFLRSALGHLPLVLMLRYPVGESRRFLAQLDGVLVNSAGMKTYAEKLLNPGRLPVWQIPNTLDDNYAEPDLVLQRFSQPEKMILFAGRLIPEKGVRELLLAFHKIREILPETRLMICGAISSKTPYEKDLLMLVSQFPPGAVAFSGYVPNRQMPNYYRQAHVAVFPSLPGIYLESFGMVVLEAMRCGTPVVVSHQPGFDELVFAGENGFVVDDPRDIDLLAQAILDILEDPALACRMGQAAYHRSLKYNPARGLQALEKILLQPAEVS